MAEKAKETGNNEFKAKEMYKAQEFYQDALDHLDKCKVETDETKKLKISCLQNMSVAFNSLGDYGLTLHACTKVIDMDPKAVKAWYLRSVANGKSKNFDNAIEDLK